MEICYILVAMANSLLKRSWCPCPGVSPVVSSVRCCRMVARSFLGLEMFPGQLTQAAATLQSPCWLSALSVDFWHS